MTDKTETDNTPTSENAHDPTVWNRRIPITVIGGFLGAGKTTLVNQILRQSPKRIGVIVNEFGKVGVDGGLIEQLSDDVQELTAGCLCCSGRDDLIRALVTLAYRAEQQGGAPEHVLIELSGVADPVPVLHTLLDPNLRQVFWLDGLVTVADARTLVSSLSENPEVALQLAYATAIVLNKSDLVSPPVLDTAMRVAAGLQPLARLVPTHHAEVDAGQLLNLRGFDAGWTPPAVQTRHTPGLKTLTLKADTSLSLWGWQALAERIITRPGQVLRVKGHLSLDAHPEQLLVQAVRDIITIEPTGKPRDHTCQLVMIGRDLNPAEEQEFFQQALNLQPPRPAELKVAAP